MSEAQQWKRLEELASILARLPLEERIEALKLLKNRKE